MIRDVLCARFVRLFFQIHHQRPAVQQFMLVATIIQHLLVRCIQVCLRFSPANSHHRISHLNVNGYCCFANRNPAPHTQTHTVNSGISKSMGRPATLGCKNLHSNDVVATFPFLRCFSSIRSNAPTLRERIRCANRNRFSIILLKKQHTICISTFRVLCYSFSLFNTLASPSPRLPPKAHRAHRKCMRMQIVH